MRAALVVVFFFFQAEDGIRDVAVTGVQTCALPILATPLPLNCGGSAALGRGEPGRPAGPTRNVLAHSELANAIRSPAVPRTRHKRSEERRVGKECRSRWSPYH